MKLIPPTIQLNEPGLWYKWAKIKPLIPGPYLCICRYCTHGDKTDNCPWFRLIDIDMSSNKKVNRGERKSFVIEYWMEIPKNPPRLINGKYLRRFGGI